MRFLRAIYAAIEITIFLIEEYLRKRREAKVQKDVDAIEANPTNWLIEHFGGVRGDSEDAMPAETNDTVITND